MPRFDGTGPQGQGPRTGRGMGPCGRGLGWGRGLWSGRGHGFRGASPKNELTALENEEKVLEEELAAVREEKAVLQKQS